jgi:hypothetical protein
MKVEYRKKLKRVSGSLTEKVWYFRCPNCTMPKLVVTSKLFAECGGRYCRGRVYLPKHKITESQYRESVCE